MDTYQGQVDLDHQNHDFNPGVSASGVFWTAAIPMSSVQVNPVTGAASLRVTNLALSDGTTVQQSLTGGPTVPAQVSFDITWNAGTDRRTLTTPEFAGTFVRNTARMQWSASAGAFRFTADPANSVFATVGRERNGAFLARGLPATGRGATVPRALAPAGAALALAGLAGMAWRRWRI